MACPEGMACNFQQDPTVAIIDAGYYRFNASSVHVVKCPVEEGCSGNATWGNELCADGHGG